MVSTIFQFLYGAINGSGYLAINNWIQVFQFLYGAINGRGRLINIPTCILFQFLYGAINGKSVPKDIRIIP